MKNFQPGGLRGRKPDLGGRPQSDVNKYAPKNRDYSDRGDRNDRAPRFENRNSGPKKDVQLFSATCTTCGKGCEVPFRPDGTKPVLCRDCFATKNASPTNMAAGRDRFTQNELVGHKPARSYDTPKEAMVSTKQYELLLKQLALVETKVSQILELITVSEKLIAALPLTVGDEEITLVSDTAEVKKIRKPKKEVTKKAVKKAAKKVAKKAVKKAAKKVPAKAKKAAKKSK